MNYSAQDIFTRMCQDSPILRKLDPRRSFLDIVWLHDSNPVTRTYGARVAALVPFGHFTHLKFVPVFQMMREDFSAGIYADKTTLVVRSSGNAAHAAVRYAPCFGFKEVKIILPPDVPEAKASVLKINPGVIVIHDKNALARALEEAAKPGHYELDQYSHLGNVTAHQHFTGHGVTRLIDVVKLAVLAIAVGSGGTLIGVTRALKSVAATTTVLGVQPVLGEQVPGARDKKKMEEVSRLPLEEHTGPTIYVSREDAFKAMRKLWESVEPQPGPTSGLAWAGLQRHIATLDSEEKVMLRGKVVAFLCPDDARLYTAPILAELDPE